MFHSDLHQHNGFTESESSAKGAEGSLCGVSMPSTVYSFYCLCVWKCCSTAEFFFLEFWYNVESMA